jgi:hypothetical protein
MQRWHDELILKIDELRSSSASAGGFQGLSYDDDDPLLAEEHDPWYALPRGYPSMLVYGLTFPLRAALHLTMPEVHQPGCMRAYPLTLLIATIWLALLSYLLTFSLEKIGCALNLSSTIVGLTLGGVGLSFPNLYACILTAQAGQPEIAVGQAFGSSTFNLCIALGLVWLFESLAGACTFGALGSLAEIECHGCYMPVGFAHACPYLSGGPRPPRQGGSLVGTCVFALACLLLIVLAVATTRRISQPFAAVLLAIYGFYLVYEIGVGRAFWPVCLSHELCL